MGAILGLMGTGAFAANADAEAWERRLFIERPNNKAILTTLLSMISKGKTDGDRNPIFNWWEETFQSQRLCINNAAGYNDTDATFTVDTTSQTTGISGSKYVRKGTVLLVESTGEHLYVTTDPTTDTSVVVTRGFGTTAAAAIADNAWLTIIGTAHEHGGAVATAQNYTPTQMTNYCQIFKETVNLTKSAANINTLRSGDEYKDQKRRAMENYAIRKEMAYLFGELKATTGTKSQPLYTTRGIKATIETYASDNIITGVGNFTERQWDNWVRQVFTYGSESKLLLAGNTFLMALDTMAKNGGIKMQTTPKEQTYGMSLSTLVTSSGELQVKSHPLFNVHPVYSGCGFILDMENISEVDFRATKYNKDLPTSDDMILDEYIGESGIKVKSVRANMYIAGVTGFAG